MRCIGTAGAGVIILNVVVLVPVCCISGSAVPFPLIVAVVPELLFLRRLPGRLLSAWRIPSVALCRALGAAAPPSVAYSYLGGAATSYDGRLGSCDEAPWVPSVRRAASGYASVGTFKGTVLRCS